jgi:RNA polymerase sigma factor (sigma-70 family)
MTTHVTDSPPSTAPQTPPQAAAADKAANGKPADDRELLRRFVRLGDQAAFAALVRRHSGLVIGVCRRVLRSEHDIEDAFQATFLVLARDAGRIRKAESLASWLHGVAYRTSLRAADSTRRRGRLLRELTMIEDTLTPADDSGPLADVEQRHQQQALDEELASLSDNYRAALVLHYLDGKSNQQVAEKLGLSVTAVEGRLKRGKKELRLRLARRGIGLSVAVAAMQAVQSSAQAAPLEPLIARAIDAGLSYAGGEAAGPVYSPEAARLAGQELMTMSTTTTATLAAVVLLPLALGFAGHVPAVVPAGSSATISTTLAQVDATETTEELSQPATDAPDVDDPAPPVQRDLKARVVDALASQTSFSFDNVPLYEAINELERQHNIPISILLSGIGLVGATPETPVSGSAEAVRLDNALMELLKPHQLGMVVQDNGLTITAAPLAEMERKEREQNKIVDAHLAKEQPQRFDERSPNAIRIEAELQNPTALEFFDTPLRDAIEFIAELHNIRILVDEAALADVGVATDQAVNLVLQNVELQSALNHILRPQGLTTIIRDEVLQVTTKEIADEYLVTRVYDIGDLAGIEQEQLLKVLQESLADAEWKETDGQGGTASILDDALVVKQSQSAHRQIVDLLGQLRRHLQQRSQSQTSVRTSETAEAPSRNEFNLDIDADGRAWFHNATITTELLQDVLQRVQHVQQTVVVLRVDPSASSAAVSRIIDAAKAAGISELKFALRVVDPADEAPADEAPADEAPAD